jgi:hypothetical protein
MNSIALPALASNGRKYWPMNIVEDKTDADLKWSEFFT